MTSLEKFLGTILGVALGDAVGAPFEGTPASLSKELVTEKIENLQTLTYTDDTQMTLDLASSLSARSGFDPNDVVQRFLTSYNPARRYGQTTSTVLQLIKDGTDWIQASKQVMNGEGSYGNGAAMRIAPVALLYHHDKEKMLEIAKASSELTHAHPLGIEGAIIQAAALRFAILTSPTDFDPAEFLSEIKQVITQEVYAQKINSIHQLLEEPIDPVTIRERLGCGGEAFNSVPTAIYCFLTDPTDFISSVSIAVSLGGDTDTIASMTGALVGALTGKPALPEAWLEKLENRETIERVAQSLFFTHVKTVLGHRCEMCLSQEGIKAYKIDPAGPDNVDNYILLCARCKRESEEEEKEFFAKPRKHGKYRAVYRKAHRRA